VFSHSSWHEDRGASYERLEFLGDAILGAVIAEELCRRHPDVDEGVLAKFKAQVVSAQSCAEVARGLGLGQRLETQGRALGRDDASELAANPGVLAALTEAVIGAIFIERGYDVVRPAVVGAFAERMIWAEVTRVDHKTALQEHLQRQGRSVEYVVVDVTGPPHRRLVLTAALVAGSELGRGVGATKKASEQEAARAALQVLEGTTGPA
jgi:ribonuclease-3